MRWRWATLAGVLSALAITVTAGAVTPAQGRHNRTLASDAAARLAAKAVLPAGSTAVSSEPAGGGDQLRHPLAIYPYAASVDHVAFFITSATPDEVVASVRAHLPAGARRYVGAYSSSFSLVDWTVPSPGGWAPGRAHLGVGAVTLPGHQTGVRIDANVRYRAPHPPAALIPRTARSVKITMTPFTARPLRPAFLIRVVTSPVKVRRLAALIDGLPLLASFPGEAFSCPALATAPVVTITFRDARGHPVATTSVEADTPDAEFPCFVATFSVRGHQEPGLMLARTLLRRAGAIAGLRLVRRG